MGHSKISKALLLASLLIGCDGKLPGSDDSDLFDAGDGGDSGSIRGEEAGVNEPNAADGSSPDAGIEAGSGEPDVCGDGVRGATEFCDGDDLRNSDCQSFGFSSGELSCNESCMFDLGECVGVEVCFDGLDNDGDEAIDCDDSDCSTSCAQSCAEVPVISSTGLINGNTKNRASTLSSGCLPGVASSGSELVFRVVAPESGVLEATLTSVSADLSLSIRVMCGEDASELVCSNANAGPGALETVKVRVLLEQELFLVVDGAETSEEGAFALQTVTRPLVCGDGFRDPGEACDDANPESGDGCSSSCGIESTEGEPNDTQTAAQPYGELPVIGEIASTNDIDVFSFTVEQAGTSLLVETLDLGDGACASLELDNRIEILTSSGTPIASNDDGGEGFCAVATASDLEEGTYYVRVSSSGVASSFPYRLRISTGS